MERWAGERGQHRRRTTTRNIPAVAPRPRRAERYAMGENLRKKCPRTSHADWRPSKDRPDPVQLIEESDKGQIPQLVPLRHGECWNRPLLFIAVQRSTWRLTWRLCQRLAFVCRHAATPI